MHDDRMPRIGLARNFAALLLFLAIGGEAMWIALRVRSPLPDPAANRSVAALIVSPTHWPEAFAGLAFGDGS